MKTLKIQVDNLKCGGCATTIRKGLLSIQGVEDVKVNVELDMVEVFHRAAIHVLDIKSKLKSMGYPEKGSTEGFEKFTENLKSYVSCAIGRLNAEDQPLKELDKSQRQN